MPISLFISNCVSLFSPCASFDSKFCSISFAQNLNICGFYDPKIKTIKLKGVSLKSEKNFSKSLLDKKKVDLCFISVPHNLSLNYSLICCKSEFNPHLVIEKPFGLNLSQAKNLDYLLKKYDQKIDVALRLSVSLETIKKRILDRKNLEKRTDDSELIAVKRFEHYENNIRPVIDFYKQSKLLKVINGELEIAEINNEIRGLLDGIQG